MINIPANNRSVLKRTLIVTGCDAAHFGLVEDLLQSFRQHYKQDFSLGFLNFRSEEVSLEIQCKVDHIVDFPRPSVEFDKKFGYFTGFTGLKARLPDLFPHFDYYCWIDADCWFQNAESLPRIFDGLDRADICIHLEHGREYVRFPTPNPRTRQIYSINEAGRLGEMPINMPMVNAGVFAMAAASPIWELWRKETDDLLERHKAGEQIYFSDQIPLHKIIYKTRKSIFPIRAIDNWPTYASNPMLDRATRSLRDPVPPHEELGIIHLAGPFKPESLRYRNVQALFG
jgi:hypothetical protein